MKKFLGAGLLAAAILIPAAGASAETGVPTGEPSAWGMVDFDHQINTIVETSGVDGGKWDHGVTTKLWSNYWHPSKYHRSSVQNGSSKLYRSETEPPDEWSYISIAASGSGNKAWWASF
ncbi:lactococcin 972 family bacteriocin [Bacillus mycoides]|uniref:Lactococcin 972 family bacteriocin n=1 Tax=Bacillus mycoides TaxID=1405 RepID=A0ABC9QUW0_BACMY|nr:lactococcin 972 family bacteriocin [Bacillus mycoides]EJR29618.1 lactococcin 972 family bacteriocin [Bacillus mycoides]